VGKDKQKKHEGAEVAAASGKMRRKEFEKELAKLQVELVRLQTWVQAKGARIIVVFEGRDTAGKGGVISRVGVNVACDLVCVEHDQPYKAIIDTADRRKCDAIVMASHGRRGVSAIVLGSETVKVLSRDADGPTVEAWRLRHVQ
jgi:nucleotide-binding universal stress UspA family protein